MHSWIKKEKKKKGTFFEKSTCKDRWRENKWFSFTGKIEKSFEKRVLRFSLRETIISRKIPAWIRFKLARSSKIFTGRIHAQTSEWRVRKKKKRERESFFFLPRTTIRERMVRFAWEIAVPSSRQRYQTSPRSLTIIPPSLPLVSYPLSLPILRRRNRRRRRKRTNIQW